MTDFPIEKSIPMPSQDNWKKYPLEEMDIGDSISISGLAEFLSARGAAYMYGKRNGLKFSTRQDGDGGRIWRVE